MLKNIPIVIELYKCFDDEANNKPTLTLIAPPTYNFDEINAYARGACDALALNHFIIWYQ